MERKVSKYFENNVIGELASFSCEMQLGVSYEVFLQKW